MNLRLIFFITAMLLTAAAAVTADDASISDAERLFSEGNSLYEAGEYGKAVEKYSLILKEGLASGELFYNLGNAYLKTGDLGRAALNYERAGIYMPGDSDLLSNRRFAAGLMKQQDMVEKRHMALRWLDMAMSSLTLKSSILLVSALYYLLISMIIVTKVFGVFRKRSTALIVIVFFAVMVLTFPVIHKIRDLESGAVVVAGVTDAVLEPVKDAPVNFPLFSGMKVFVLREKWGWTRIMRPDGKIGWVNSDAIRRITPVSI